MKYLNQHEYAHIPYMTRVKKEGVTREEMMNNVSRSGCGPCSICMLIDIMTDKHLEIEECIRISEECGANHGVGTDLRILGPVIADKFGLDFIKTNDLDEAINYLRMGAQIVVHVRVKEGEPLGLFTKRGHYMLLTATDGKEFCILDPSYSPEKYTIPERVGRVDISHAPYLYCDVNVTHNETIAVDGRTKYYVFKRKR